MQFKMEHSCVSIIFLFIAFSWNFDSFPVHSYMVFAIPITHPFTASKASSHIFPLIVHSYILSWDHSALTDKAHSSNIQKAATNSIPTLPNKKRHPSPSVITPSTRLISVLCNTTIATLAQEASSTTGLHGN